MPDTIEAFVSRLQTEGLEQGKQAAEKICQDAQAQAQNIVKQAQDQASRIIQDAENQANAIVARGKTELDLAARDTLLKLRDALSRVIEATLRRAVNERLEDADFLKNILHELILSYAKADIEGDTLEIHVSEQTRKQLLDWVINEIAEKVSDKMSIDLKSSLHQAGFEYSITGSTVEVTVESVTAALKSLVGPELRDVLDNALAQEKS